MARKRKRSGKKRVSAKAALSLKRGHKPVALLEDFRAKMIRNVDKLGRVIAKRKAAGE